MSKSKNSVGRSLVKKRFPNQHRTKSGDEWTHQRLDFTASNDWNRLNLRSVTDQNSLDEFLTTAQLAGTDFAAERLNVTFVPAVAKVGVLSSDDKKRIREVQNLHKDRLSIPRRPAWTSDMSAEQIDQQERASFLEWRRKLALLQEVDDLTLTPFEKNLEFWRQLWRVIEKSDVIVQIVDARNPLLFRCEDLENYVRELSPDGKKINVVLINKADLLTDEQRLMWANYFDEHDIRVIFYSALESAPTTRKRKITVESESLDDTEKVLEEIKRSQAGHNDDNFEIAKSPNQLNRFDGLQLEDENEEKTKAEINVDSGTRDEDDDDDDDDDDDEERSEENSDATSSDRFSIKSDLAQVNEESSKARRTPPLYIRPHLRAKFVFDQLIQVLPQSPSDTNQPATVEIISANSIHTLAPSLVEERQLMSDFIGPLTSSTAKSNVTRYCERQSQLANKATHIIDRDALSILWKYMALLVNKNGVVDVRVDIPKILWSSSNTPVADESSSQNTSISSSTTTLENSLREFLALGEIDTSIKFACENQLYTHALIISYLTDRQLFEKTIHNIISNLDNGDILKTFYELGAGSTPSVVTNVTKPHYGDWKRHLAVILANRTDVNAQFVDLCVKTMGDALVTSGRIYAGHFCYLIASVPFGSYRNNADKVAVIGSVHAGQPNLSFATIPNLQLTEVYEYSLRTTLVTFIPLKIYYTSKLVLHGLKREALAYCEEIGHTLIRQGNTSYVQLVDLQLFILIAEKSRVFSRNFQLDPGSYKEPAWLIELRRLIQSLLDNAFLNKTVRDESFNSSLQTNRESTKVTQHQQQQPMNPSTYPEMQTSNINHRPEQITSTASIPPSSNVPTLNIANGYNTANPIPTDQMSYSNVPTANYQNNLKVDTNVHYPSQYYPPDTQAQESSTYPQQWSQQPTAIPTQSDHLTVSSQVPSTNNSYYQPSGDQSQYIQPGYTSTPNPQSAQQQHWYPPGHNDTRDRLPSNENNQTSSISDDLPQQQHQQTNGIVKKKHACFDDSDDVFPNNAPKSSDSKTNTTTSSQAAAAAATAAAQKGGMFGNIMKRFGLQRPPQAHLPDDKNKAFKFDEKTGKWIDTSKSESEQAAALPPPPPSASKLNTAAPTAPSSQLQQPSSSFNPSMPPGMSQQSTSTLNSTAPPAPSQIRTPSFTAGTTTTSNTNTQLSQITPAAWPTQPNVTTMASASAPAVAQPVNQSQLPQQQQPQPQQQQRVPGQLSAAQQRLQAIRQQQQQQQQQQQNQAPPAAASNQYSLRNRPNQSRYVDVLAGTIGTTAPNPNVSLNDLIPTPSAGMPTYAPTNQANNYFVPQPVQSTTDNYEQSPSSS